MKEVHYHSWLSNPVQEIQETSWDHRLMSVDFKDLNKACHQDGYPLPEIDWKVESLCGYLFKCFLDAYKGYHQIKMAEDDEDKTSFITSQGIFCYSKMPFGLKNVGATYQRLVDRAFQKQIGRNLEVYVDDLVIKSHTKEEIIRDIAETFKTLQQISIKLNLKKCTFGMQEGMFLGYKVNADGLKLKITVVLQNPEEVHKEERFPMDSGSQSSLQTDEETHSEYPNADRTKEKGGANHDMTSNTEELPEPWTLFTDGSSCIDGSGVVLILTNPKGVEFTYAMRFRFEATNNEAEYEALIPGLRITEQMGVKNLQANVDSRLVANQVNGSYVAKESGMVQYLEKVKTLTSSFKEFSIKQVPRSENKKADSLSKIASISFAHLSKQVLVEELNEKSINEKGVLAIVEEEGHTWMTPICEYLTKEILPKDKKKARAVRRKASRYAVINGTLYKKSFLGPWLRCVGPLQANYVLREIHEGSCSMHSDPRSVVAKAIRTGYYWPTMHIDARKLIKECNDWQNLTPITSPWPFYKWGIDIAGPFPEGPGKVKFLIVAIDYFTKWIEAKPVATITGNQVKKFVWDNIVCRFGLPGEIVSDNGKQFRDNPFKDWCEKLCIRQCFASVKHPQTNGLVERANRSLGEGIKARLDERSKDWIGELSHVLWAHRTMIKSSNGETPFSLTYGTEAVIPAEIGMPTLRTAEVDLIKNDEALEINLDLLEEKREQAAIQEAKSKAKMEKYYNSKVRGTSFKPGDMVYRSNDASHAEDGGKLGPKWEGPYEVTESLGKGAYKLKDRKGNELSRTWNICNLKKCYIHEV
ncbi:reverse transcriptase domain-containing protein [Tanacetum coccineum]